MKVASILLVLLLLLLQYPLWFTDTGILSIWRLSEVIATQRELNQRLNDRNAILSAEVIDLKEGSSAIEERARTELGMIKPGEIFYHTIEEPQDEQ